MGGTSGLFTFSIIFLIVEFTLIFAFQNDSTGENFVSNTRLLDVNPPPAPEYDTPWYNGGSIADVAKATWYIGGLIGYTVDEIINLVAFPYLMAGKIINISSQYSILLLVNSTVIVILAYSILSRIMGGD